ncbi:M949_RS01915 family surface polysaccharide biosynthesis protein [Winogradskyella thalassocola]|uniref:Uncharacterized protein n=1 Tax=Winogradskyella thalassocola TaxID=262004 RepID=A0A1G8M797_9FLAO|nr:hypothetical protein [Winogradskyella thalassocola]SDI63250.1 hypothetical protein SAMN04489796_1175 [Winogradskyella thalassocola]
MKRILILFFILIYNFTFGQKSDITSKQLSKQEIDSTFTDHIKAKLQLDYSIHKVYQYNDQAGMHFIVMTKNLTECVEQDACSDAIKAYCYTYKNDDFKLKWMFNDFILPNSDEYSISYWTKYFKIDDYDNDGFADPIMVYGTFGMNDFYDGRIKILIYYKNKKSVIRHQNAIHDDERQTQIDKEFYELPTTIKNRVTTIIENITENDHGIFPSSWQKAMKNKTLKFDDY